MLQILNGKGRKGRGWKKEPFPIYRSWNGLSKYTTETQWKMTQAAWLWVARWFWTEPTANWNLFSSLHVLEEAVAEGRAGNGHAGGAWRLISSGSTRLCCEAAGVRANDQDWSYGEFMEVWLLDPVSLYLHVCTLQTVLIMSKDDIMWDPNTIIIAFP